MITPVENGKICSGDTFNSRASAMQVAWARVKPSWPVPALALPVLITMARIPKFWPLFLARCSRQICTGAAQNLFCVKTAPTDAPSSSSNTARSLRLALRMPASVIPQRTPGTGNKSAAGVATRLTGIASLFKKWLIQFAVAMLEFFTRTAGARVVAAGTLHLFSAQGL